MSNEISIEEVVKFLQENGYRAKHPSQYDNPPVAEQKLREIYADLKPLVEDESSGVLIPAGGFDGR